jgi:isoamylase
MRVLSFPSKLLRFYGSGESAHHNAASEEPISCPYPLGASVTPEGTNFSVFSASAKGMQIVLFDHPDDPGPAQTITLDPVRDRTSHYWHIFLPGINRGQL